MTAPGWYVDFENPKQMRYHDGAVWTDHVYADRKNLPDAPVAPAVQDTVDTGSSANGVAWDKIASFALLGLLIGFMVGAFLFNGIGAITPTTETAGTVSRIDIEISTSSGPTNRRTHVLLGTTAAGESWRIVDETAYDTLRTQGLPQPVVLAMGDWTGTPERVTGDSFVVDHQSTGARAGWAAMIGAVMLASLVAAYFIARAKSAGSVVALVFVLCVLGPGTWLGYQGVQWMQSA